MPSNFILLEISDEGIAMLTLNRPEKHNVFDDRLIEELITTLQHCAQNPAVRVLILKAKGENFSAGADLNWMKGMIEYSESENIQDALRLNHLLQTLNEFPKPTLAAVQGHTFGGGIGLIACCDIAIAAEDAAFCFSEVSLGLAPAVISPYVMAAMGARACRRYFLTAELFNANTAKETGLIHEIVASGELAATAIQRAKKILQHSHAALRATKKLILDLSNAHSSEPLSLKTATLIGKLRISQDAQTRLRAFLDKKDC